MPSLHLFGYILISAWADILFVNFSGFPRAISADGWKWRPTLLFCVDKIVLTLILYGVSKEMITK